MNICGFSFVRNAIKYDYPVKESIRSILPIVDEFIIKVGNSEDNTLELIQSIDSSKLRIGESIWDDSLKLGGYVLAVETNKALDLVPPEYKWAFYLQADEVVHENDLDKIMEAAKKYENDNQVEGLLFNYKHFYGSYNYTGDSRRWYSHEIRLIKNTGMVTSYKDAQGFRTRENKRLQVKPIDAHIYHYGWVRHPAKQHQKIIDFSGFWNGKDYVPPEKNEKNPWDFSKDADSLKRFTGEHPAVMKERIAEKNWDASFDTNRKNFSFKNRVLYGVEKLTGKRLFEYKNYIII